MDKVQKTTFVDYNAPSLETQRFRQFTSFRGQFFQGSRWLLAPLTSPTLRHRPSSLCANVYVSSHPQYLEAPPPKSQVFLSFLWA